MNQVNQNNNIIMDQTNQMNYPNMVNQMNYQNMINQMNYQNMLNQMNYMNMMLNQMNALNQNQEDNKIKEEHELIKCVLEGMGEESSDNLDDDFDKIMNFVPSFDSDKYITFSGCTGKFITVKFQSSINNIKTELTVPEDAKLKDVFIEYGKKLKLNNINSVYFLINGQKLNKNSEETLKDKNIDDKSPIVVIHLK